MYMEAVIIRTRTQIEYMVENEDVHNYVKVQYEIMELGFRFLS